MPSPSSARFQDAYLAGEPPWVIGDAEQSGRFGVPVGGNVDLPTWLALVRRTS